MLILTCFLSISRSFVVFSSVISQYVGTTIPFSCAISICNFVNFPILKEFPIRSQSIGSNVVRYLDDCLLAILSFEYCAATTRKELFPFNIYLDINTIDMSN